MHFGCSVCAKKYLDLNILIRHLKKDHDVKDGTTNVKCVANYKTCQKSFLTISGLRNHAKKCIQTVRNFYTNSAERRILYWLLLKLTCYKCKF